MPRKPVSWPGPDFAAVVRSELDSLVHSLGFELVVNDPGEKNKSNPQVRYRKGDVNLQIQWDPWDCLLEVKLGPRFHMKDVVPRVIVHTHYQFYLEAMNLADAAPTYEEFREARGEPEPEWRKAMQALKATLPEVISRYSEIRPLTEQVASRRLPNLVLLGPCGEA
jgi:hypothetical protein